MGCTCAAGKAKQPSRAEAYQVNNVQKPNGAGNQQSKPQIKKLTKKEQQLQQEVLRIYSRPEEIAKLAFTDVPEFIKTIKKYKLQNLAPFVGYEADPPIVLQSSKSVNTLSWNPFTVAVVLGKNDLYNFIIKEINFNLKRLVELNQQHVYNLGHQKSQEDLDFENMMATFTLMVENNCDEQLRNVLNDLSYLFRNSHIKRLLQIILRSPSKSRHLDILLNSKPFRTLFLQKVKSIASNKYKTSFNNFYDTYLCNFETDSECIKVMTKVLSQPPFNVSFMIFLINEFDKKKSMYESFIGHDLKIKGYDLHRIGVTQRNRAELTKVVESSTSAKKAYFAKFVETINAKLVGMERDEKQIGVKIQELFDKLAKGDLSGFKSKTSSFPREDLSFITGAKMQDIVIQIPSLNRNVTVSVQDQNALQLACILGHSKIVQFLIEEWNLKAAKDFQRGKNYLIDDQYYILAPLFKKDAAVFSQLLQQSHLWTYDDLQNILHLLKQTKWFQGVAMVLESRSCQEIFFNRSLQERFRFIRDFLVIPFKIDQVAGSSASLFEDEHQANSYRDVRNVLTDQEKRDLRNIIKTRLCKYPYTGAFLFQEFAPRRDTYRDVAEDQVLADDASERLIHLRNAIANLEDLDLHDYIKETQGNVVQVVQNHLVWEEQQPDSQYSQTNMQYREELQNLISKIQQHQTFAQYVVEEQIEVLGDNQL